MGLVESGFVGGGRMHASETSVVWGDEAEVCGRGEPGVPGEINREGMARAARARDREAMAVARRVPALRGVEK